MLEAAVNSEALGVANTEGLKVRDSCMVGV
jgi:hypothetical protein